MNNIRLIKDFAPGAASEMAKDLEVSELFDGAFRKLIEVRLRSGALLSRHKAKEPITVFCISGNGVFKAGENLEELQALNAGILITLDAGVEHEVVATSELHLIVTKFKNS